MQAVGTLFKTFLAVLWIGMGFCSAAQCAPDVAYEDSVAVHAASDDAADEAHCEAHCPVRSLTAPGGADPAKDLRAAPQPTAPVVVMPVRVDEAGPRAPPFACARACIGAALRHLSTIRLLI